eukprot:TRINITY_DN5651_c0_g1_i2.p3 TRINITY_DN5651_c0_g1~~TRINITY_DN5651_c0_g1_i2.p3  ORF type:complete len:158 (-),score=26.60 TRINITY_DN5651_c0_g1_i2:177-650(-)
MTYCNAVPIAQSCYLGKDVTKDALDSFIAAVIDLTTLEYNLTIKFNFVNFFIENKNLKYNYEKLFIDQLNDKGYEKKMRKSDMICSEHWNSSYEQKWADSSLSQLLKKPDDKSVRTEYEKTLALKIMSLDLNTTEKTAYSQNKAKQDINMPKIVKHS